MGRDGGAEPGGPATRPAGGYRLDVLAIGPHPDDCELFCGGTLATLAAQGRRVGVLDLTRGELASNGTVEQRAFEARRAAEELGLRKRRCVALPDGELNPWVGAQVLDVVRTLREMRPEIVLAPPAEGRHPDHEAAHQLVRRAVFLAGLVNYDPPAVRSGDAEDEARRQARRWRPREVLFYEMRVAHPAAASVVLVDVSEHYETKWAAVGCYGSQVAREGGAVVTMVNAPESHAALRARDAARGAEAGVAFAEALRRSGPVATGDLVALLRSAPGEVATLFAAGSGGGG